jgi:hypothetical protein
MRTVSQLGPQQCQILGVSVVTHWLWFNRSARRYQAELNFLFGSPFG